MATAKRRTYSVAVPLKVGDAIDHALKGTKANHLGLFFAGMAKRAGQSRFEEAQGMLDAIKDGRLKGPKAEMQPLLEMFTREAEAWRPLAELAYEDKTEEGGQ